MEPPKIKLDIAVKANLTESITKLIEVVKQGVGTIYKPIGTIRQAKADAKTEIIEAKTYQIIKSLQKRTERRLIHTETIRQENIESVISKAAQELPQTVSKEPVDKDWIAQFFNNAQDVNDGEMQTLWARILAGEVSSPGSYSKRTLQFLKTLDKEEAEAFTIFCSFAFTFEGGWHFIIENTVTIVEMDAKFGKIAWRGHFNDIGLVYPEPDMFPLSNLNGTQICYIDNKRYMFATSTKPQQQPGGFKPLESLLTLRKFSQIGQELSKIAGAKPIEGYVDKLTAGLLSKLSVKLSEMG